ncbi:DUF4232 domain-containing protein [Actinoplanes sp. NPDC049681]|uniref:DUF4232 domain-containing protein n=1 Tax=Actinoplanes sp. NPDC049681 TaxID=3363905 RepID=UPI0037897675
MNWRPLLAVPAVCTAALLALTACGQDTSSTPPAAGGSTASSSAPAAAGGSTASPARKGSAPAGVKTSPAKPTGGDPGAPTCTTSGLKITVDAPDGGAGHSIAAVHFRNTGATCRIKGYPTVVGRAADGTVAQTARQTLSGYAGGVRGEISPYLLHEGDTATALIETLNANEDGTACEPVTELRVSPPKQTGSVTVPWSGGCARFEVHPVVRGLTGRE